MIIDVFAFMRSIRSITNKITTVCSDAYPDNKLDSGRGIASLSAIGGMVSSIKAVIESKITDVETKGHRFRSITDDSEPDTPKLDFENTVYIEDLSFDYYRFFSQYVDEINGQISFQRKTPSALHSVIQRIQGANNMMISFLESLEKEKTKNGS